MALLFLLACAFALAIGFAFGEASGRKRWKAVYAYILSYLTSEEKAVLKARMGKDFDQRSNR